MASPRQTAAEERDAASEEVLAAEERDAASEEDLAAEDFYYEGPYVVFTAAYHRKRGYCCESDCRHCPYKAKSADAPEPI